MALNPGESVQVTADPVVQVGVAKYVFVGWSDGGAATHTITVPTSPPFPAVSAKYQLKHSVSTVFTGRGLVTVSPSSPDGYYDLGTMLTITATPATGYQFTGWSGDLSGSNATQTITVGSQIYVQASFSQPFTLAEGAIVNAASFLSTPLSPGEIVTIFGLAIGPPNLTTLQLDSSGKVATTLAGTRVLFSGVSAPLVYVAANQISAIVPYEMAGRTTASIQVQLNGKLSNALAMSVAASAPGMFTIDSSGRGAAAILNQDGTLNSPSNPALKGSVAVLFVTGEGQTTPAGVNGKIAVSAPLPKPLASVSVRLGGPPGVGREAQVLYAGAAPQLVAGVMQINILIPADVPSGPVPISFTVGNATSVEMTTIAIQ